MKINQNISAVIVNDQLLRNENSLSESVRKLSSGLKFNRAKDNPSGVAISYKMQVQINALSRASTNATDGTSIVRTIDSAIGEMTDVTQRMRELCVQAASDTNTLSDREAIQKEVTELKKEINRISTDTEFNGKTLLDGTLDRRTYVYDTNAGTKGESMFNQITNVIISDSVKAGSFDVVIHEAPSHAVTIADDSNFADGDTISEAQKGTITINGAEAEIKAGMTVSEVYEAIRDAGNTGWVNVFASDGTQGQVDFSTLDTQGYTEQTYTGKNKLTFVSQKYGSAEQIQITCDNPRLTRLLGLNNLEVAPGKDVVATIDTTNPDQFTGQAVVKNIGDQVVITDKGGFEMSFEVRADIPASIDDFQQQNIVIEATDIGTLQLQIGANEEEEFVVRVPVLNTESLYIDDLDVTKVDGASEGISMMDKAIKIVSAARTKMGAYENSLEFAEKSLDATVEDMTSAISSLGDVDMAGEMTTYTSATVLTQASISVLAQANDLPQQVLSLLQG